MDHTIIIEKIIHGGQGLGRLESGIVVLVPFVLPGEKVVVQEKKIHRGFIQAELVDVIESSPERITPPCPWYMQCGGCDLQHMHMDVQHRVKQSIVGEALERAGVKFDPQSFKPIIPSPANFHYRHRIRLKVSEDGAMGFHRQDSNEIVEVEQCLVAAEELNSALRVLRDSGIMQQMARQAREVELVQNPSDHQVSCIFHIQGKTAIVRKHLEGWSGLEHFAALLISTRDTIEQVFPESAAYTLSQDFAAGICGHSYSLHWSPGNFSQVNAGQNAKLVALACRLAGNIENAKVLDLFCGTGNFSIPLALTGAFVTGVEREKDSILQARRNAEDLDLRSTLFLDRDVHKWIRRKADQQAEYKVIILDPPRKGLGKDILLLAAMEPERIISISCDPATQARDASLAAGCGYRVSSITPLDMFPQTHHVESVVLLEKN